MPWVNVNGSDTHYVEAGSGQPLVFLHGNSSCGQAWFQQFAAFSDRFRCIAYDSVNHGHSANSPRDADEPDRADELEGFLAAPFGDSFTPQFEAQQPDMHARYYRIRSTATRIEALRHPRKASAKTVAERAGMVDAVKKITSPLQIITGDLDTALEAAQGLHAVRPDVGYVQMPGAPHNAYWEMAKEWNAVAVAFLDSVMAAVPAR